MAMKHSVYDTDTHFTINPVTRTLQNEASGKTRVIQNDHNSERFTFEVPRYIEGHDISLCNVVQVHYCNIDAQTKEESTGVYVVDDMQVSPHGDDMVVLSWLISQNATKFVGSLNFLVRFSCVDDDGTVQYAWHSAVYTNISVSTGIYNGDAVVEEYADVLEVWKAKLESNMLTDLDQTKHGTHNNGVNVWTATLGNGQTIDFHVRDGKTPVKGVDYWTEEDQGSMTNDNLQFIADEFGNRCRFRVEFVDSVDKCVDPKVVYVLTPDMDIYTFVGKTSYPDITIYSKQSYVYTTDGELIHYPDHSCKYTDLIPVQEGDQFLYTGYSTAGVKQRPAVLMYDKDGNFIRSTAFGAGIPGLGNPSEVVRTDPFTVPADVSFVRFHSMYEGNPNSVTLELEWVFSGTWENSGFKFLPDDTILPLKTSDLENDAGYITAEDIPEVEVPTNISELENDSGFITEEDVPKNLSEFENDEGYLKESSGSGAFVNYGEGYKVNIGASTDIDISSGNKVYLNGRYGTVIKAEESEIATDFSNQRITNIADPEADTDGVNKKYVDNAVKNVSGGSGGSATNVPTKLSELENDVGYVKSEEEYGYIGFANKGKRAFFEAQDDIAIVSESVHILTDGRTVLKSNGDGGVALNVSSQRIANLANPIDDTDAVNRKYVDDAVKGIDIPEVDVPTKTSDLENDNGFITINDVPKVSVPTKTSELTNDSGFITGNDVPSWAKQPTKPTYTAEEVGAATPAYVDEHLGETIESVKQTTTSTEDGGTNVMTVTLSDGTKSTFSVKNGSKGSKGDKGDTGAQGDKGEKGDKGDAGANGKTPIKGTDYWTEADKAEITNTVEGVCVAKNQGSANAGKILVVGSDGNLMLTDMPTGISDVTGVLDEDFNILLSGDLADGTYTLRYKNTNGTYSDAVTLVVGEIPDPEPEEPQATNWIPNSINADGTPFVGANGEKGYKTNTRMSIGGGNESTSNATGLEVTGFIPIKTGDTIYLKGITIDASSTTQTMVWYNSSFQLSKTASSTETSGVYTGTVFGNVVGEEKSLVINASAVNNVNFNADVAYIRITAGEINADSVINIMRDGQWT